MIRLSKVLIIIFVAFGLTHSAVFAGTLYGRVIGITDGDTIKLLTSNRTELKVRLVEIDAPERGQPWGNRSKQALSNLVYARDVRVVTKGKDRYGRVLGRIFIESSDVNAELVRMGAAWAYRAYLTDKSLLKLEADAREARRGLWSLPPDERSPPWEWRNQKRHGSVTATSSRSSAVLHDMSQRAGPSSCGKKTYCRQMASCEEARFYLRQCGLQTIDGDRDGVPCENICGS